jgi:hypothetical protein
MKRSAIFFLGILLSLYSVYAQGINIGGENISFIVLLPLIIIIGVGIAFTIMILNDKAAERRTIRRETPIKAPDIDLIKRPLEEPSNILGKITSQAFGKKPEEINEKEWVNYLDIIDSFIRRLDKKDTKEAFSTFISILREFFKERFELNYEFTYDELVKEFQKKGFNENEFILNLKDVTYKDKKITKKDIFNLAVNFNEIINKIDRKKLDETDINKINKNLNVISGVKEFADSIQKKENIFDEKLNRFLKEQTNKILKQQPVHSTAATKDFEAFDKNKVEQITHLIRKGRKTLERKDFEKLREIYSDICYLFPFLSDKSKKIAYLEILEFYEDINKELFPKIYKGNSEIGFN